MIDGVHKLVGAEPVVSRRHIHLERQHIGRRKLLSRFQHAVNAIRPPRRVPICADRIFVAVGSDAPIAGCNKPPPRLSHIRHLGTTIPAPALLPPSAPPHPPPVIPPP